MDSTRLKAIAMVERSQRRFLRMPDFQFVPQFEETRMIWSGRWREKDRKGRGLAQVDSLISAALGRIYRFSTQEAEGNIQDQWRRIWRRTPWRPGI
jgi:hypothetical protein